MGWFHVENDDLQLPIMSTDIRGGEPLEKRNRGKLPDPDQRKGTFHLTNSVLNKKQQKILTLSTATLGRLANTDPVTWAIRRTIKSFISQVKWDIVPDTEDTEAELSRYEEIAIGNLNPYAIKEDFSSEILNSDLSKEIEKNLKRIMKDPIADKKGAIRWYFQTVVRKVKQEAESHRHVAKRIFQSPNGTDKTWRTMQEKLLDDILVYDAGVLIKNWSATNKLAEIYTIPGQEVKIYRNEDGTAPEAPEPAYVWEQQGINRAEFSSDELIYLMMNPQQNGYGFSPLEVAAYVITASLYADEYQIDSIKNSNVPPGVFDLGKNVDSDQLSVFRQMWENEIQGRGGQHRMVFISGAEEPKFIPMSDRSNRDMQLIEYIKWTTSVKCMAYGISVQDLGYTENLSGLGGGGVAEVQERMSKSKGVQSLLSLLTEHYNTEIVKSEYPYTDIKFEWHDIDLRDSKEESSVDLADITAGVISRNERRRKLGMKPIDGGDEYIIQTQGGLVPVSSLEKTESGAPQEPGVPGAPQPGKPGEPNPQEEPTAEPVAPIEPTPSPTNPPTNEIVQSPKDKVKIVVDRNKPIAKQQEMLDKAVDVLKQQGIESTIHISFDRWNKE